MLRSKSREARYVEQLSVEAVALAAAVLALVGNKPTIRVTDDRQLAAFRQMHTELRTIGNDLALTALAMDQRADELDRAKS